MKNNKLMLQKTAKKSTFSAGKTEKTEKSDETTRKENTTKKKAIRVLIIFMRLKSLQRKNNAEHYKLS